MAFTFAGLNKCSYKNVVFLYDNGTKSGGRKTATHEFIRKNTRFVEDLGKNQRTYSINGIIAGAFYQTQKNQLEQALNDPELGVLVHPFDGNVTCKCTGYSLDEDNTALGVAKYSMTFLEAQPNIYPSTTGRNQSFINRLYKLIYGFAEDYLKGQLIIDFIKNISYMAQRIDDLVDLFKGVSATIDALTDQKSSFDDSINTTFSEGKSFSIASDPDVLGQEVTNLFQQFDSLAKTARDRFNASAAIFNQLTDNDYMNPNTLELQHRDIDRKILNGSFNVMALTNMLTAATLIEYKDTSQIDEINNQLNNAYVLLINNPNNVLSESLEQALQTQRTQVRKYFDALRIVIPNIIEINTAAMPVAILTYQYYGNTDNYDEIIDLNQIFNPAQISGEVEILSA